MSRFYEEQINARLRSHEAGMKVGELCRTAGISEATFDVWRSKYGGLEVSQLRRLKELEVESAKRKKMSAEFSLTHEAFKDVVEKKAVTPDVRRERVSMMVSEH